MLWVLVSLIGSPLEITVSYFPNRESCVVAMQELTKTLPHPHQLYCHPRKAT